MCGRGRTRTPTRVQVQIPRVHRVLSTVAVENLAVVLVILAVVGPSEAGAQTKVCQLDVPVCIYQDVVGLDVSVDESHLVDAVDGTNQLRDVELCEFFLEDAKLDEKRHQVSARYVIHYKVEVV